ncbi:MAG TPA: hypothetical protein VK133_01475 [Amoebophilaceae bacterium]|nr:hypothetical protein [Amoebophilaceae bacterium]
MNKKKYFSSGWMMVVSMAWCAAKCHNKHYAPEEAEAYYTHNPYVPPSYTPEEFEKMLVIKSPEEIGEFRKKLEKRLPQWTSSGTEPTPFALWQNYRQQVLSELEKGSDRLTHCYNQWGALLQTPNEATEKEVVEAYKQLQADVHAQQRLRSFVLKLYNHPNSFICSESALAYQSLICFIIEDKKNMLHLQHLRQKQLHSNLKQWKKDGHPSGVALWKMVQEQHFKKLKENAVLFQYQKNLEAIEKCLVSIDRLVQEPDSLSYEALQSTIPHGLTQLDVILAEASLKEEGVVKALKLYRNLIKL